MRSSTTRRIKSVSFVGLARMSQDSSILTVSAVESPSSLCGSNHLFFFKNLHYLSVAETLVLEGDYSLLSTGIFMQLRTYVCSLLLVWCFQCLNNKFCLK